MKSIRRVPVFSFNEMKLWTRLVLLVLLLCVAAGGAKEETNDIHDFLQDLNVKETNSNNEIAGLKRLWGMPDSTAYVGRIFNYTIPDDAFSGEVDRYLITEAGEPVLPNWLYFESETRTLRGVPTEQDVGHIYINVKAVAKSADDDPLVAKDVFSIDIIDDPSYFSDREKEKCSSRSIQTVMTVIADANMADLSPHRRYDLILKMASYAGFDVRDIKLVTLGGKAAYDEQALRAGPGNTHSRDGAGVTLKWIVGCEGAIKDTDVVSAVEKSAKDGELATKLGLPIIGWHITTQHPVTQTRIKRQNHPPLYGTPVPGIVPPSLWTSETIDDIEPTEDSVIPESRVVPTMSSPIYTMSSHRHRHHHSDTDRGHHRHHTIASSPVFTLHSTPVMVTALPTKYIESSMYLPEESFTSSSYIPDVYSTEVMTSPPITATSQIQPTRSYPVIEPSKQPDLNFQPNVVRRLKKMTMVAGKLWTFQIPHDTFTDMEDGDTRNLKLIFMTSEKASVLTTSWIQFDPEKQELYALPLEENIGQHQFIIEAMDSEGKSTFDRLHLVVWEHPDKQPSHSFKMVLRFQKWQYPVGIDWQIEVLRRIARLYNDPDDTAVYVRNITLDPTTFIWSNDTLNNNKCERDAISELYDKLATDSGIARPLRKIMQPEFRVQDVSVMNEGACKPSVMTTPSPEETSTISLDPILRNAIEEINTTVGDVLQYIIPEDTFFDEQDGGTRKLRLRLMTINNVPPHESSWVQFDQHRQMIQALPTTDHVGKHEYYIEASDKDNRTVNDVFILHVRARKSKRKSVEFSVQLDQDFEQFIRSTMTKLLLARKLARLFGDADAKNMQIVNISHGSVVFAWTNKTLPVNPCPEETIRGLVGKLMNEDDSIKDELIEALKPEFKIISLKAIPLGHCLKVIRTWESKQSPALSTVESTTVTDMEPTKPATSTSDDDIYITTVIPAVVIAIMLIIAAMVACFLYRKKRKGKMTMQDTSGFMSKGVPIIFADEIEEKPDPAKPPVIMKDEKPPLSQPNYQTTSNSETTPQMDRRESQTDPPYQPPPPFTASREAKNGRPKTTPTYRQPPPYYVPP